MKSYPACKELKGFEKWVSICYTFNQYESDEANEISDQTNLGICRGIPTCTQIKMILMTKGSLMKVEMIAECSPWSILQYFWPAFSDNRC